MIYGNLSTFKDLIISIIYWIFIILAFSLIRYLHPSEISSNNFFTSFSVFLLASIKYGFILGLFLYIMKTIVGYKNFRSLSFGQMLIYRNLSYIAVFVAIFLVRELFYKINVFGLAGQKPLRPEILSVDSILAILAMLLFAALFDLLSQVALKFGRNNFWKMIIGRYHSPKEEEKIFMFLDLQSSTAIAEKLGHRMYSKFIQECFQDISVIGDYDGEVYQYVGDEAVFSWDAKKSGANKNSIEAFYAFQKRIEERKDFYQKTFGIIPVFKAGVHGGQVMVAEVGLLKKEIAFHGDTINTAARIQELCNEKGTIFLTSDYFKSDIEKSEKYDLEEMGDMKLRGRRTVTKLYHPSLVA